jgi:hypothetical protein
MIHRETGVASGNEKEQGNMTGVVGEVGVVGVKTEAQAIRDGTDEEVSVGALKAAGSTEVVELGSAFVVFLEEGYVGKQPQVVADLLEGWSVRDAREKLLTDGTDDTRAARCDQLGQRVRVFGGCGAAAECRRPDRRIHEHVH